MPVLLLLAALLTLPSLSAVAAPDLQKAIQLNVEKYQLPNGLTVLLQEDHTVPLVSFQQWFRVGSKDEDSGRTGLAHFFEHMMFKGTAKYPKDVFGQVLGPKGADFNAFTTADYTGYYITLPSENLQLAVSIESDRMRNLLLDPKDVTSEREVVKEERRMRYDNQPEGAIRISMDELIFHSLPYRWPVIGSMEDLNKASNDDLRAFYKRYYSPNNAVVVAAGDFDPVKVKKMIADAYGGIPSEKIERKTFPPEWNQPKAQEKLIKKNVESPIVTQAYLTPPASNSENFPLDLIMVLLGQGESSRLYKKLVYEKQIATSVNAGCQEESLASRCMIYVFLKPGVAAKTVQKILDAEIQQVIAKKIGPVELEKAKNNYLMEYVNELAKLNGRAQALAYNEILFNDYRRLFTDIPAVQAVTADQIQSVAKKYLKPEHKNVVILVPEGKKVGV